MTSNVSCLEALEVLGSPAYQVAEALVFTVDVFGIGANSALIGSFVRTRGYHANIRILFLSLSLGCLLTCVVQMLRVLNMWLSGSACESILATFNDCQLKIA